jgi:TolA-binding protein
MKFLAQNIAAAAAALLTITSSMAQTPPNMQPCQTLTNNAQQSYELQKYSIAINMYQRLSRANCGCNQECAYRIAACSYHLNSSNANALLTAFTADFPYNIHYGEAQYMLAKLAFASSDFGRAKAAFADVDAADLEAQDMPEYRFKYGYALYMDSAYEQASAQFERIKDDSTRYSAAALYYWAHIAYQQKNYNIAAAAFERLVGDATFGKLAPYYILHIAHSQRDFDKIIARADSFMSKVSEKRAPEMARIVGEAHYFKGEYDKSLPYIEKFMATAPALTRADHYLMGYIYYQNKEYAKAAPLFEQIVAGEDSLSQMAHYYLADAWLHLGEKYKAGQAFAQAARMDCLPEIQQDAAYNYAKLMYELRSGPFTDAIEALTAFIAKYPASAYLDDVYAMLMQAYMWSRNYGAAWTSLKVIRQPDAKAMAAKQKIAHYLAVEHYQNQRYAAAEAYFDTSLMYSLHSPLLAAQSTYWKGEALFAMGQYYQAKSMFAQFLLMPTAMQSEEYKTAHYNLAYCCYKVASADTAYAWFQRFINLKPTSELMLSDALCRMGDYKFERHEYSRAIEHYGSVMQLGASNVDYACYQSALCYGLTDHTAKKIELLDRVIARLPRSAYIDNAKFEKGRTYTQQQDYNKAALVYQDLLQNKDGTFYARTLLEMGLISINTGKQSDAMRYYKQVVEQYPGSAEMRTALYALRNIYVEQGDAQGYIIYAGAAQGVEAVNESEQDSVSFAAAEHAYYGGNYEHALPLLLNYIADFPKGAFLLDANFYTADIYLRQSKDTAAIPYYEAVLKYPRCDFTENALSALSALYFNAEQYGRAYDYYATMLRTAESDAVMLTANRGMALSAFMLRDYKNAAKHATALLDDKNISDGMRQEMHYVRAKCHEQNADSMPQAMQDYAAAAVNVSTKEGAEAMFRVIEYDFGRADYEKVEKQTIRFSKLGSPHQYWIARAFIVLGDVYVQRGDAFQAKATYESILDGYGNAADGIKDAVRERISLLLQNEANKERQAQHKIMNNDNEQ